MEMNTDTHAKDITVTTLQEFRETLIELCKSNTGHIITGVAIHAQRGFHYDIAIDNKPCCKITTLHTPTLEGFCKELLNDGFFLRPDEYLLLPQGVIQWDIKQKEEATKRELEKRQQRAWQRMRFWIPTILSIIVPFGLALLMYYVPLSALETRVYTLEHPSNKPMQTPTTQPTTAPATKPTK